MHTLTLRIYLTVVAVLFFFACGAGWIVQRHMQDERVVAARVMADRMSAWGELIQRSLPGVDQPENEQAAALLDWSQRLRLPLALDNPHGRRIAASELFMRRQTDANARGFSMLLEDGRTLWVMRPERRIGRPRLLGDEGGLASTAWAKVPEALQRGVGLVVVLMMLFVAVAAGAWPAVRRLTSRLQALKQGVEQFGAGQLQHRVEVSGRDEVAAVAASFNGAAERIEALVRSHQSLLANASHELRSPLARMKMAVSMLDDASPEQRERLKHEINTNVAELDALVEEVLMASRLDAAQAATPSDTVDLLALAAEEGARVDAVIEGAPVMVPGDERLLRRALRNLLENARRYGGGVIEVKVSATDSMARVQVNDRGPGVPQEQCNRIFEPFYRLPGHAEQSGGVGLGLSLVKQIADRHKGRIQCLRRDGGGSCFELTLPTR